MRKLICALMILVGLGVATPTFAVAKASKTTTTANHVHKKTGKKAGKHKHHHKAKGTKKTTKKSIKKKTA